MIATPPCGVAVTWELRTFEGDLLARWLMEPQGCLYTREDELLPGALVLWAKDENRSPVPVWLRWETQGPWVAVLTHDGLVPRPTLRRGKC